jgi:hypothetical protein
MCSLTQLLLLLLLLLLLQARWSQEGLRAPDTRLRCAGCGQQDRHHLNPEPQCCNRCYNSSVITGSSGVAAAPGLTAAGVCVWFRVVALALVLLSCASCAAA